MKTTVDEKDIFKGFGENSCGVLVNETQGAAVGSTMIRGKLIFQAYKACTIIVARNGYLGDPSCTSCIESGTMHTHGSSCGPCIHETTKRPSDCTDEQRAVSLAILKPELASILAMGDGVTRV